MDSKQKEPVKKRPDWGWDWFFSSLLGSALYKMLKLQNTWFNIIVFFVVLPLLLIKLHEYFWRWRQKRKQRDNPPV
jgi:hypothetical protein